MNFILEQAYFITDSFTWAEVLRRFEYSDIYQTYEYVGLESDRINGIANLVFITMPTGCLGIPLILRKIPHEDHYIDAVSVYGYNGVLTSSHLSSADFFAGINKIKAALAERHCVSFFNRESNFTAKRLPEAEETGKVLGVDLEQTAESYEKSLAEGHRQEIRALRSLNYKVIQSSDPKTVKDFHDVYKSTMLRRGASINYFFSNHYFDTLLKVESCQPHLKAVYHEGKMIAGAIFITQGDHMYYMFSGSILNVSPYPAMKLILDEVIRENLQKGKRLLHLGGGLGGKQDSLYQFKYGFGKTVLPFYTTKWILLPEVYRQLSAGITKKDDFFPKYRMI